MNLKISLLALAFGVCAFAPNSHAVLSPVDVPGAPAAIDYQGKVLDANGAPLSATPTNYVIQFRLWNDQSASVVASNLVWAESQVVTVDSDGTFSVRLGTGIAILNAGGQDIGNVTHDNLKGAFNGKERYIGVTVVISGQTATEIVPRLQFLTSPFALVAETARNVTQTTGTATFSSANITNTTIANATVTSATINGGTFTGNGAALNSLNASNISSGTINIARLPAGLATTASGNNFSLPQTFTDFDAATPQLFSITRPGGVGNGTSGTLTFCNERFGIYGGGADGDAVIRSNRSIIISSLTITNPGSQNAFGIVIDTNNNVGIGTRSPGTKLDVNGSLRCVGAVNTSSDARYKTEIRPVAGALDTIGALRGVSYDWNRTAFPQKNFPTGRALGFIGQEVEKVLPEAVSKDAEGYYSVAYSEVIPVLVEATKELRAENTALRASLAVQEKRLAELEAADKARDGKLAAVEKLLMDAATRNEPRTVSLEK